jgi:hypothetical protein
MNIPSEDIIDMLEAQSALGLTYATNLFRGREPSSPRNCVTVYDTMGFAPDLDLDGNNGYERPSVQIRVRNADYDTGLELAQSIKDVLHGVSQETWNTTLYSVIYCSSGPALLDWDDNNNARFVLNFNIQRR